MAETQRVLAREPAEVQMSIRTTLRKKKLLIILKIKVKFQD